MSTGRRGRPAATDPDSIVAAALRVLERGGFEALTMRAVAEELGVSHATVHRHVTSRDHLVDLLLADLHRRLPAGVLARVVDIRAWEDGVALWAEAAYREASAHPGALALLARLRFVPSAPEAHELLERIATIAIAEGVPLDRVLAVVSSANAFALGLAALRIAGHGSPQADRFDDDVNELAVDYPTAARLLNARQSLPSDVTAQIRHVVRALADDARRALVG